MKVRDPQGQTWRVSRRWVPWRRKLRGYGGGLDLLPSGLGDDPISAIIFLFFLIICLPFVLLALVAGLELALLVLLVPVVAAFRVPFGRHWYVEVRRGWVPWWEGDAGDFAASRDKTLEIGTAIQVGNLPLQTLYLDKPRRGRETEVVEGTVAEPGPGPEVVGR